MNLDSLGEFGLISRLTGDLDIGHSGVVVGVGDDAAVLETGGDDLLLVTCDAQIQDVHFKFEWSTPVQVGGRAASVNLSDIAAMGGEPAYALISLQAPSNTDVDVLDGIYKGLKQGFSEWNVQIVGGNTASHPERIAIDVTLIGRVPKGNVLLRSGATPGDIICVTGELGSSAAGLELLKRHGPELLSADLEEIKKAYIAPRPRVAEGLFLGRTEGVTSCIDLSDGLLGDSSHVADLSGVALAIDLDRVPTKETVKEIGLAMGLDAASLPLRGGEDFEFLFTLKPDLTEEIIEKFQSESGTSVTVIGEVRNGKSGVSFEREGREVSFSGGSFDHFCASSHDE